MPRRDADLLIEDIIWEIIETDLPELESLLPSSSVPAEGST